MLYGNDFMYQNVPTPSPPRASKVCLESVATEREKSCFHVMVHSETNYNSYDMGRDYQVHCKETR